MVVNSRPAPKGLMLDFGGVISVTFFERHRFTEALLGLAPGALTWRGPFDPENDPLWLAMLAGEISERDYWARRAGEVGRMIGEDWMMATLIARTRGPDPNLHIRPEAIEAVRRAKARGVKVGVLSNEMELFYGAETVAALAVLRDMDAIVDATQTQILKPAARAYALGCEALGVAATNVVFVDDQPRNVEGARRAGLDAVLFDVTRPAASFAEAARRLELLP